MQLRTVHIFQFCKESCKRLLATLPINLWLSSASQTCHTLSAVFHKHELHAPQRVLPVHRTFQTGAWKRFLAEVWLGLRQNMASYTPQCAINFRSRSINQSFQIVPVCYMWKEKRCDVHVKIILQRIRFVRNVFCINAIQNNVIRIVLET